MIKNFRHFVEIPFLGMDHLRDPTAIVCNLLLALTAFLCFRRLSKTNSSDGEIFGWKYFFLFGGVAYLIGVPVHGFSFYFPELVHFWIWVVMGWFQIVGVYFAQLGHARKIFPQQMSWLKFVLVIQMIGFAALMVYIRKFAAVNIDIALGLLPIAGWNFYQSRKNKSLSTLIGTGILFAILPAVVVVLQLMPSLWLSYNDIAHLLLIISIIMIYRGVEKNNVSINN
jgi:hypothetical protein